MYKLLFFSGSAFCVLCVQDAIGRKEWARAVLMSLHLNERELREKAVDAVPISEVPLTAAAVPAPYALRLLGVLADRRETNGFGCCVAGLGAGVCRGSCSCPKCTVKCLISS